MKVLITGASGYIGARIYTDLSNNHEVVGTYHNNRLFEELQAIDITDQNRVFSIISENKPDFVVHAAAIASRNRCRKNPSKAFSTNAIGTKNVVEAANEHEAEVIYISSLAAIEPVTVYGKTKLSGEERVEKTEVGYDVLRASMTYGYSPNTINDRPFNKIVHTIREGQPTHYDNSWMFQPTYLKHISDVISQIIVDGTGSRTINVLVPEFKTRYEIASDILQPFGRRIDPVFKRESREKTENYQEISSKFPTWSYAEMIEAITAEIQTQDWAGI